MGIIQAIINFIKRLLGLGGDVDKAVAAATSANAISPANQTDEDEDEDEPYALQEWKQMQALIAEVESSGMDLAGVDPADPSSYYTKVFAIEAAQSDGTSRDDALRANGFHNADHYDRVSNYMMAKWSELVRDEDGEPEVRQKVEFTNGALAARQNQFAGMREAAAAADPTLLQPVEGVSVDDWAAASAEIGQGGLLDTVLAKYGMDAAKWDRVNAGWQAKMQGDTTMVIATKFGDAFSRTTGATGGSGGEPISFERYVEIMAAQEAWAASGMDVNAQLQAVFGISAADYGGYSGYWGPKMGLDLTLMQRYDQLRQKYLAKYQTAGADDDLTL